MLYCLTHKKLCVSSNLATAAVNESTNHEQLIYMAKNNLENVSLTKNNPFAEPICSSNCWQLDYLKESAGFVKQWHAKALTMSLTPQTTLANELTFVAMANLATYLIEKGMSKVPLGKLSSDPIEKCFGQFRQLSSANFLYLLGNC